MSLGFEFSQEELLKIFEIIANQGLSESAEAPRIPKSRFTYDQYLSIVKNQRDADWLYKAYIRIHSMVLQKATTYKRLFAAWRGPKSKAGTNRLTRTELTAGLKKLKTGLT